MLLNNLTSSFRNGFEKRNKIQLYCLAPMLRLKKDKTGFLCVCETTGAERILGPMGKVAQIPTT